VDGDSGRDLLRGVLGTLLLVPLGTGRALLVLAAAVLLLAAAVLLLAVVGMVAPPRDADPVPNRT
jgi:hypothetical protein